MREGRKLFATIGIMSVLLLSLLTFVSCSDQNITNEEPANLDLEAIYSVDLAKQMESESPGLAKLELNVYLKSQVTHGFEITNNGYSTSFNIDGKTVKIEAPRNSFDENKWGKRVYIFLRVEKWITPNGTVYYYDCSPGGIEFKNPLILDHPYENSVSKSESLFWFNPAHSNWVVEDVTKLNKMGAAFEIDHFSKYAIAD